MKVKKSREYTQDDGSKVSFTFDRSDGRIIGISKNGKSVSPLSSTEFTDLSQSDDALAAYNVAKYGAAKKSYVSDQPLTKSTFEVNNYHKEQAKKEANEQFIEDKNNKPVAPANPKSKGFYDTFGTGGFGKSTALSYPLDLNLRQDHFKIMKYKYQRRDVNASKPGGIELQNTGGRQAVKQKKNIKKINVAGDSVIGSQIGGSVLLPMPKATDVNGVEWGKSELTISGLAAVGLTDKLTGSGRLAGKTREEVEADKQAKAEIERGRNEFGSSFQQGASAMYAQTISKIAGFAFGTDLDVDTYLARSGGRVLNPNAEMLFQGPVIRDFNFSFLMIARSQREGNEIRKIIRFLKLGMAPKFRSTTYLKNPDIFTLHYKNGTGDNDELKTVNKFNPGGLALTTMAVDYAPNGYWSAYRDSQPVAVKMDLSFTELRPIYEQDQLATEEDSVGY